MLAVDDDDHHGRPCVAGGAGRPSARVRECYDKASAWMRQQPCARLMHHVSVPDERRTILRRNRAEWSFIRVAIFLTQPTPLPNQHLHALATRNPL